MIKAGSFSTDERTHRVFEWISIIWLTSAVIYAGCEGLEIKAESEVPATCGYNVTLTCSITSSEKLEIILFSWVYKNKTTCLYNGGRSDDGVMCESTEETPKHHSLTLTLINVRPADSGEYLCKLRSNRGVRSARTLLRPQDCLENSTSFINSSHAECHFTGVYPRSSIHWFQGDENLTDYASTTEEVDQHGSYNIQSQITRDKGNLSPPYNCSLWTPHDEKYVSSQQVFMTERPNSVGSTFRLQWIGIMVEIVMLKLGLAL